MRFSSSILRPGTVVDILEEGVVKVTSPGLFSVTDDPSLLPPVLPFAQGSQGSFSSPKKGDNVWVFHDQRNTQLFFYIRLHHLSREVKEIIKDNKEVEVVFSRNTDEGVYQIFFSEGVGLRFGAEEGSYIQIDTKGNINIISDKPGRAISLSQDSICIGAGTDGSASVENHAAYGEKVEDCLQTIKTVLERLQELSKSSPYTSSLSPAFISLSKLSSQIDKVTSSDVKII